MAKLTKNQEIEFIIDQLEFKIKKHIKETVFDEREDLSQEIKLKIIEKIDELLESNEEVPGFFEYVTSGF
ncbi:hypothetical protein [Heyndrickxia ginsengihumi]|uniref:hypothetical protein n=1 Tax=Heyndrickxia ginsengihumi TaxID=363870 RepID=UPI00203D7E53|nr:hypothetical protein [Heyndrickxia ginsengihumi]MCM3024980.1 hypothetical protein [Heyndrickxia ginsengihumi]